MKKKWMFAAAIVLFLIGGCMQVRAAEEECPDGLLKIDGKYYYYEDGEPCKNEYRKVTVKGEKRFYYFQKDGSAFTDGIKKIDDGEEVFYCYFKKNGQALTDRLKRVTVKSGKKVYFYFKSNGKAATDCIKTVDGKTYYFGENGKAYTGKLHRSHYLYYFDENGVLFRKIDKNKKMVALTYDDGPSIYTPDVLDTLEKYDAVATFFVVGNRVATYEEHVIRAYKMGCEIGNHTYEHKYLTQISQSEIKRQRDKTNAAVKKVIGANPVVFRPPGGYHDSKVREIFDMPAILWSIDPKDWKTRDAKKTIAAIVGKVKDGDIVLMHDLYQATAEASKTITPALIEDGYQLVTVSELAECRGELEKGVCYNKFPKK